MRHPQWQMDTPVDDMAAEESLGDSLKDVQELSLRLSVDGEKNSLECNPDELEKVAAENGDPELQDQVKRILSKIKKPSSDSQAENDNNKTEVTLNTLNKYPILRRRRRLFVIALDCYDDTGHPDRRMLQVIQEMFKAVKLDSQLARISGFALSTAMPISETVDLLKSGRIQPTDFDAIICSSGSEVYYPGTHRCMDENGKLCPDPDYATHIEYRWEYDGVRRAISKLMNTRDSKVDGKSANKSDAVEEDVKSSSAHCISFLIKDYSRAKRVDDLRQKLRMRGLRCHLMYCRNSSRLQAIPLLASRSQALRYLFVRWGLNVANMFVILGEKGDTDREEMITGSHRTIILKGVVEKGSEELLRTAGSYHRDDIVPGESPLTVSMGGGLKADEILTALREVSKASAGK